MKNLIIRWFILFLAILTAAHLIDGIHVNKISSAVGAALLLGVLNVILKPVLIFLTLPFTILTLGLFLFVINAIMLWITAFFFEGVVIDGFFSALLGALVISLVSWFLNWFIADEKKNGV